ncbi:MAG: hypothetical protein IPL22_23435 [Bacteroidetes bacterium]|nr:hypothetical protein [Bacteroidota bacterium]
MAPDLLDIAFGSGNLFDIAFGSGNFFDIAFGSGNLFGHRLWLRECIWTSPSALRMLDWSIK